MNVTSAHTKHYILEVLKMRNKDKHTKDNIATDKQKIVINDDF
jgi:hypothetical protein